MTDNQTGPFIKNLEVESSIPESYVATVSGGAAVWQEAQGGLNWYDPQTVPESPDSLDEEFDGSKDAAWSWNTTPTSEDFSLDSWIIINPVANTKHYLSKSFTPGSSTAFGLEAMFSLGGYDKGDLVGIAVRDSSDNTIAEIRFNATDGGFYTFSSNHPGDPIFGDAGTETLLNKSFEDSFSGNWTKNKTVRDTDDGGGSAYDGSYFIRGTHESPTTTPWERYIRQDITLSGSDNLGSYRFSCWLRRIPQDSDNGSNGRARARVRDPDDNTIYDTNAVSHTDWREYSTDLDLTASGVYEIWFTSYAAGGTGWSARGHGDLFSFIPLSLPDAPLGNKIFLRLHRDASDIYKLYWSDDGVTYKLLYTSTATSTTVDDVSLIFEEAGGSSDKKLGAHYIRRYE